MMMTIRRMALSFSAALVLAASAVSPASAVKLSEVIRLCGDDGKRLCAGVRYGQPMQDCLVAKREKASAQCRPVIDRLKAGEKVRLF